MSDWNIYEREPIPEDYREPRDPCGHTDWEAREHETEATIEDNALHDRVLGLFPKLAHFDLDTGECAMFEACWETIIRFMPQLRREPVIVGSLLSQIQREPDNTWSILLDFKRRAAPIEDSLDDVNRSLADSEALGLMTSTPGEDGELIWSLTPKGERWTNSCGHMDRVVRDRPPVRLGARAPIARDRPDDPTRAEESAESAGKRAILLYDCDRWMPVDGAEVVHVTEEQWQALERGDDPLYVLDGSVPRFPVR